MSSISSHFENLGAPLKNSRWSWGAVRPEDGAVFLRVWQDRKVVENHKPWYMITHHEKYQEQHADNLGYQERNQHVALIRQGRPCFLVMCLAKDAEASPREIKSFNQRDIFVAGEIKEIGVNTYVQMVNRLPIKDIQSGA